MFAGINSMREAMERLENVNDYKSFDAVKFQLQEYMKKMGMEGYVPELEKRAFYFLNDYSEKDTNEKMEDAKRRVIEYICEIMQQKPRDDQILLILENFYLFLENFLERMPDKRGGIQKPQLDGIRIKNEYDVQHLLYAYLKPLYPLARMEVNEDTGYSTVRTDIFLDSDRVIEVKCSRGNMRFKKLVEELAADCFHYSASNIYFFIYDKEKIVENPDNFKNEFPNKVKEKQIHVIIHQPKRL